VWVGDERVQDAVDVGRVDVRVIGRREDPAARRHPRPHTIATHELHALARYIPATTHTHTHTHTHTQESCAIAKMTALYADKSKQTATTPPKIM